MDPNPDNSSRLRHEPLTNNSLSLGRILLLEPWFAVSGPGFVNQQRDTEGFTGCVRKEYSVLRPTATVIRTTLFPIFLEFPSHILVEAYDEYPLLSVLSSFRHVPVTNGRRLFRVPLTANGLPV